MKIEKEREIAIEIIKEFEELLNRKGIQIPSQDREGKPEEACLYGSEYYEIEDEVTDILKKHFTTDHNETILEALNDYKKWFIDGVSAYSDSFSESDNERVSQIDNAIEFIRGG